MRDSGENIPWALQWALQDSNLRLQPCECAPLRFMAKQRTTPYHFTRSDHATKQLLETIDNANCGAFYGAKDGAAYNKLMN